MYRNDCRALIEMNAKIQVPHQNKLKNITLFKFLIKRFLCSL